MRLEQEVNPKIVQKLPGRRDVSTALGVYTHVVPEVFSAVTAAATVASGKLLAGTCRFEDERRPSLQSAAAVSPAAFRECGDQRWLCLKSRTASYSCRLEIAQYFAV